MLKTIHHPLAYLAISVLVGGCGMPLDVPSPDTANEVRLSPKLSESAIAGLDHDSAPLSGTLRTALRDTQTRKRGKAAPRSSGYHKPTPDISSPPTALLGSLVANPIRYHGGPVMTASVNVYYIWYGSWSVGDRQVLTDLASSIGDSAHYNINTTYYDKLGKRVPNAVSLAGQSFDNYSLGKSLSNDDILTIVSNTLNAGTLPTDVDGVYFVLTASDVKEKSGFCTSFCGWHNHAAIRGVDIKYSFVGNALDQCPSACGVQRPSPNNAPGPDGMASVLVHELEETASDPNLNAWYDDDGEENADKCAWTFGTTYKTASGADANLHLGSRDFKIQQNWVNYGDGYCALEKPTSPPAAHVAADLQNPNQVSAITVATDGALYVTWEANNSPWTHAVPLTDPGFAPPGAAVTLAHQGPTQLDAFVVANNGSVYVLSEKDDGPFTSPVALTGASFARPGAELATGAQGTNQLDLFVVDNRGAVNVLSVVGSGAWTGPTALTGSGFAPSGARLATGAQGTNQLDLFVVDNRGAVNVLWAVGGGSWAGPAVLTASSFAPAGANIVAGRQGTNQLNALVVDNRGSLQVMWVSGGGAWSGPAPITGAGFAPAGAPMAFSAQTSTQVDVLLAGTKGLSISWTSGGPWVSPVPIF